MDSDAKLQILIEALSAAGASALAIDGRGGVVISTMSDAALEQDIAAFVSERLARVGDGARGRAVELDGAPDGQGARSALGGRGA